MKPLIYPGDSGVRVLARQKKNLLNELARGSKKHVLVSVGDRRQTDIEVHGYGVEGYGWSNYRSSGYSR